jgi:hypothetical protein
MEDKVKLINLYELQDEIDDFDAFKEQLMETGTYVQGPNVFYVNADRILEARPDLAQAVAEAEDWSGKMMGDF